MCSVSNQNVNYFLIFLAEVQVVIGTTKTAMVQVDGALPITTTRIIKILDFLVTGLEEEVHMVNVRQITDFHPLVVLQVVVVLIQVAVVLAQLQVKLILNI